MAQEVRRWKYSNNSKEYKGFRKTIEMIRQYHIIDRYLPIMYTKYEQVWEMGSGIWGGKKNN